jgi:hypothetical protein
MLAAFWFLQGPEQARVLHKDPGQVWDRATVDPAAPDRDLLTNRSRSASFSRVCSVTSIDSRPNEHFVVATIAKINDCRNFVEADIDVPAGDRPALLTFSRPYFRRYKARIGDQKLAITSYRGLFPIVEVPPGTHGRLTLLYRPLWLLWGGG